MKRGGWRRKLVGTVILALLLIVISQSLRKTSAISDPDPIQDHAREWVLKPDAPAATPVPLESVDKAPHPSLEGTSVNGGIRVDAKGRMVLHRDARRLFDYFLSLRGRMDHESIRALLRQHLEASQERSVVEQALALFDQYVSLIDAEAKFAEEWTQRDLKAIEQVAEVLAERRHLRRQYLGDGLTEAFYQEQEQYEAFQLERMKIGTDPNLSAAEKKTALSATESLLSPQQREIRKQTFAWLDIKQLARQPIDSLDVESADAIRRRFGDYALDRLAAVEHERKTWGGKREAWLAEKARLQARTDLSEDEKKAQLQDYGHAHLDAGELRRMQILDSEDGAH